MIFWLWKLSWNILLMWLVCLCSFVGYMFLRCDRFTRRKSPFLVHEVRSQDASLVCSRVHTLDQFMFLGNCPPTPPPSQHYHFSLRAKCWLKGRDRWAVSQKPKLIPYGYIVHVCFVYWISTGCHNNDPRSLPRNAKLKELCLTI